MFAHGFSSIKFIWNNKNQWTNHVYFTSNFLLRCINCLNILYTTAFASRFSSYFHCVHCIFYQVLTRIKNRTNENIFHKLLKCVSSDRIAFDRFSVTTKHPGCSANGWRGVSWAILNSMTESNYYVIQIDLKTTINYRLAKFFSSAQKSHFSLSTDIWQWLHLFHILVKKLTTDMACHFDEKNGNQIKTNEWRQHRSTI